MPNTRVAPSNEKFWDAIELLGKCNGREDRFRGPVIAQGTQLAIVAIARAKSTLENLSKLYDA